MLQIILYLLIGLIGTALALFVGYRQKGYHVFLVRQYKIQDDEYDRIYRNG